MRAIFVESGHGSGLLGFPDCGAVGKVGGKVWKEREIVVELGRRVLAILKSKAELKGCLIQGVGIETAASTRKKMAFVNTVVSENHFRPLDCVGLALHMNSCSKPNSATGFEVWAQKSNISIGLGVNLIAAWKEYGITPSRPDPLKNNRNGKYGRFYTDDTNVPYLIIEVSFINSLVDINAIVGNYDRVAECLAHGLLSYIRAKK